MPKTTIPRNNQILNNFTSIFAPYRKNFNDKLIKSNLINPKVLENVEFLFYENGFKNCNDYRLQSVIYTVSIYIDKSIHQQKNFSLLKAGNILSDIISDHYPLLKQKEEKRVVQKSSTNVHIANFSKFIKIGNLSPSPSIFINYLLNLYINTFENGNSEDLKFQNEVDNDIINSKFSLNEDYQFITFINIEKVNYKELELLEQKLNFIENKSKKENNDFFGIGSIL